MLQRIKWFQVAIIGVVLTILAGAGIFIGLIKPMNERLTTADGNYTTQEQTLNTATADKPKAVADKAKAEQEVASAKADWGRYDRHLMPNIDLSNRFTATSQLWNEQLKVLGPKVLKFLYDDRSVRVLSEQIAIAAPSGDPNDVVRKVYAYPLGTISVAGTFEQVLRHVERWNRFDRLAVVDGLTLAGNSPTLTGTYTVTIYEFSHDDKVGPEIPRAGTANGSFGGPGGGNSIRPMMGGPNSGYPGGPPMMGGPEMGGPGAAGGGSGPQMSGPGAAGPATMGGPER